MDDSRQHLALIAGYYLSRFDEMGYNALDFGSKKATHAALAKGLGVKPTTIKNMRDEFDPLHDNSRKGWHKRDVFPSRLRIAKLLRELSEVAVREILISALSGSSTQLYLDIQDILSRPDQPQWLGSGRRCHEPTSRMRTGRLAEDYFVAHHKRMGQPISGILEDTRDLGCGYDFQITSPKRTVFVEVKGLAGWSGGILLTDKEWATAIEYADDYIIAIVRNVSLSPAISFLSDPTQYIKPTPRLHTSVQLTWTVPPIQIEQACDSH